MRLLHAGYQATQRAAEDERKGVKPEHRQNLSRFEQELESGEWGNEHDVDL